MSSSHKSKGSFGRSDKFSSASNKKQNSHPQKKSVEASHTVDQDYMETLQKQLQNEQKSTRGFAKIESKKGKKIVRADGMDLSAEESADHEEISPDALKKAMKEVERDNDDRSDSRSSSHKSSSSSSASTKKGKGQENAAVKRNAGESEEAYKARLKAELRKRKNDKRKAARSAVIGEKMAAAHAAALARKEEKQRLHRERMEAERTAKAERMARERAEAESSGLTNKEQRLAKKRQSEDGSEQQPKKKSKANSSDSNKSKPAPAAAAAKPAATKPASSTPALTTTPPASAPVTTHAPSVSLSSSVTLNPAHAISSSSSAKSKSGVITLGSSTAPLPKNSAWDEFNLHPSILRALLLDLKFMHPTPIQAAVLQPAIRDWKDISAAATTGSGKTLAFGIPIIHRLLTLQEQDGWVDPKMIQAMILTPTRELALQIVTHLQSISRHASPSIGVLGVVGGISEEKQKRILETRHPPVVVATPGRLWELISQGQLSHFASMYYLRFLVLDEADRMVDFGHFPELEKILTFIEQHSGKDSLERKNQHKKAVEMFDGFEMLEDEGEEAQPDEEDEDAEEQEEDAEEEEEEGKEEAEEEAADEEDEEEMDVSAEAQKALAALNSKNARGNKKGGKPSKAGKKSEEIDWDSFLTEEQIFAKEGRKMPKQMGDIEKVEKESDDEQEEEEEEEAQEDEEDEDEDAEMKNGEDEEDESNSEEESPKVIDTGRKSLRRQIFLFSATLMLPTSGREDASKFKRKQNSKKEPKTVLDKLTDKIAFQRGGQALFTVDLSTTHQVASTLQEVKADCLTEDKDYLVYYFLLLYPGKTLIFVNSISCLRRLVNLLALCKMPVHGLHAEMQQKARLKSLDRFKNEDNSILICTDVAARGLDIPQVPYIIHYQLPRTTEIYIHRSGRVARAGAEGLSLALINEKEQKNYRRLCLVLKKVDGIHSLDVDQGYMTQIRNRMNVARQLDVMVNSDKKEHKKREWFLKNAEAMEMEIDEDELQIGRAGEDDEDVSGEGRKHAQDEAKQANLRRELDMLLSKPLMHGTLNRKFYTLNANRGFDLNKQSAAIAKAGANALEKNGTIQAGHAQNVALGTTKLKTKKIPTMLQKARDGLDEKLAAEAAAEKKPTPTPSKKKQIATTAATAAPVITSLSANKKRKAQPEAEETVEEEDAAPVAPTPSKKAKSAAAPKSTAKKQKN